jgi:hypothetical protein
MRELPLFLALGLTGMLGNQLLYIMGIYDSTANIASVYQVSMASLPILTGQPAIPIWTALFVMLFNIEPRPDLRTLEGWSKVIGILLGTGGAVVGPGAWHPPHNSGCNSSWPDGQQQQQISKCMPARCACSHTEHDSWQHLPLGQYCVHGCVHCPAESLHLRQGEQRRWALLFFQLHM